MQATAGASERVRDGGGRLARLAAAFARASGWRLAGAAGLMLAAALIEGVGLLLLVPLLGLLTAGTAAPASGALARLALGWTQRLHPLSPVMVILALYAILVLARAAIVVARDRGLARLHLAFVEQLRTGLANALAAARWSVLARLSHARVTHALGLQVERCGAAVQALLQLAVTLAMGAVLILAALLISPVLTGVTVAVLALCGLALWPAFAAARSQGAAVGAAGEALVVSSSDFLGGLKLTVSHGLAADFVGRYRALSDRLARRRFAFVASRSLAGAMSSLILAAAAAAIVALGAGPLRLPAPVLLAFLVLAGRLSGPATGALRALIEVLGESTAHEDLLALQAELIPQPVARLAGEAAESPPTGPIAVRGVRYLHPGGRGVHLADLDLDPGAFVGLAGSSGAGKTTLADLLAGLLEPQSGMITIGGAPLVGKARAAWPSVLAYLPQDPFLFPGSVRENLLWAALRAPEAEIWEALALAEAEALVRALPGGLDTRVGERGGLVSGGERQRIALARALLRRPRLLILDEALSAVDAAAERRILGRLAALAPRPTILMITHRQASLDLAERVVALEDGRTQPPARARRSSLAV